MANRLRDQWKKNPWVSGRTIDLGEYEADFRHAVRHLHPRIEDMPPSVLDWLRWRFQRLQVDRKRDEAWLLVIRDEFPKRMLAAGQRPEARQAPQASASQQQAASWCRSDRPELSKRARTDQPRASARRKQKSIRPPGRPHAVGPQHIDQNEIALFVQTHREVLSRCFERCRVNEQEFVIDALRAFVADPNDRGARDRWMRIVQTIGLP